MTTLTGLYTQAEAQGIEVYYFPLRASKALSTPDMDIAIDVDKLDTSYEEVVCLAHEMGHCATGSFYTVGSTQTVIGRCEERANRWAYKMLVPMEELIAALKAGITESYELAELFDVTEDFVSESIRYYGAACAWGGDRLS